MKLSDDISRLNLSDEKKYKLCRASTDNNLRQEYCTSREKCGKNRRIK